MVKENHTYLKKSSGYGTTFREYKSDDVFILKFSMFQLFIEEKNIRVAVIHLESIFYTAECSITLYDSSGQF